MNRGIPDFRKPPSAGSIVHVQFAGIPFVLTHIHVTFLFFFLRGAEKKNSYYNIYIYIYIIYIHIYIGCVSQIVVFRMIWTWAHHHLDFDFWGFSMLIQIFATARAAGHTPLFLACCSGHSEVVRCLIQTLVSWNSSLCWRNEMKRNEWWLSREWTSMPIGSTYAIYGLPFTINILQVLAYIPYMDPMGCMHGICQRLFLCLGSRQCSSWRVESIWAELLPNSRTTPCIVFYIYMSIHIYIHIHTHIQSTQRLFIEGQLLE